MHLSRLFPSALCRMLLPLLPLLPLSAQTPEKWSDTLCTMSGVVNVSVCNLHAKADFESPMETQALLGMPVHIRSKARWYRVETLDGYTAWVHRAVIVPMDSSRYARWKEAPKLMVTAPYAQTYSEADVESLPVGDLVSGCLLELVDETDDFYCVRYPDGRRGYVLRAQAQPLRQWLDGAKPSVDNLIQAALSLNGIPYLWAGTSTKGLDCSGLVQLAALLNGTVLPRNASQQARIGTRVPCFRNSAGQYFATLAAADSLRRYPLLAHSDAPQLMSALACPGDFFGLRLDTARLQPGDLLLFGSLRSEGREGVSHIGIYLGRGQFIHSQGFVHISSLLPDAPGYDAMNRSRLLGATRIAGPDSLLLAPKLEELLR